MGKCVSSLVIASTFICDCGESFTVHALPFLDACRYVRSLGWSRSPSVSWSCPSCTAVTDSLYSSSFLSADSAGGAA